MAKVSLHHEYVIARQLNVENMSELELWCGGSIKGTRLPPEKRVLQISRDGEETDCKMGDWIIRVGSKGGRFIYFVISPDDMPFIFKEVL